MDILNVQSNANISLINVTLPQAGAIAKLLSLAPLGLRFLAGWSDRKPVITSITALAIPIDSTVRYDINGLAMEIGPENALHFQKYLKAFGNRVADAARKPLRFERVNLAGKVHLVPRFHHLAACGARCTKAATSEDVNCLSCILAAVTPASVNTKGEFRPFGHVYIRNTEITALRDHACKNAIH